MHDETTPFDELPSEEAASLSPAGRRRKEEILALLCSASVRRHRRRLAVRGGVACAVLAGCLLVAIVGLGYHGRPAEEISPVARRVDPPPAAAGFKHLRFDVVRSRETIDDLVISDEELLDFMASCRRPAGLIRIGTRAYLSTDLARLESGSTFAVFRRGWDRQDRRD